MLGFVDLKLFPLLMDI